MNNEPKIVISDIMKGKVDFTQQVDLKVNNMDSNDENFPDPKKSAFLLMNLFNDIETYKCSIGISSSNEIKKVVEKFSVKVHNRPTLVQLKESEMLLESTLLTIRTIFSQIYNSLCESFIRNEAKKFRRIIFLLSIRYSYGYRFIEVLNELIAQESIGEQAKNTIGKTKEVAKLLYAAGVQQKN
jgi:hypothetical protein